MMTLFKTKYDWIALLLLIGLFLMAFIAYPSLPSIIPIHFNWQGKINGWGGRRTIILLPLIGTFLWGFLGLLYLMPIKYMNMPVNITEENTKRQIHLFHQFLGILKILLLSTFLFLEWNIIASARLQRETPYFNWTFGFIIFIFVVTFVYFVQARKLK